MPRQQLVLRIETPEDWDNVKFTEDLSNHLNTNEPPGVSFKGCNIWPVTDVFKDFRDEIVRGITEEGLSNLLRRQLLDESVVPLGKPPDFVKDIMVKFLTTIGVSDELIIVDPYFFASGATSDYYSLVGAILQPFGSKLSAVRVITKPNRVDTTVKTNIEATINALPHNPVLIHKTSDDYHDRFWITASRTKGLLTGTSLNGFGKRYAIIDKLADNDVSEIVASLVKASLI
jgi:hypothetical protein